MIELGDPLPDLGIDVFDETGSPSDGGSVNVTITQSLTGTILASGGPGASGGTLLTITHPGTGLYTASYTPLVTGQLEVRWVVTGANAGVQTTVYTVEQPVVGIVGLDDVKTFLRIKRSDEDEVLQSLILEASDLCESTEGTAKVWRRTVVTNEVHSPAGAIFLNKVPVASLTAITIDGTAQTLADFDVTSGGMLTNQSGITSSRPNTVLVSYIAAPPGPVPAGVRGGVLEMVRYLYGTHRGGSGLPRQEEPAFNTVAGFLIPNRVRTAWQAHSGIGF